MGKRFVTIGVSRGPTGGVKDGSDSDSPGFSPVKKEGGGVTLEQETQRVSRTSGREGVRRHCVAGRGISEP